MKHTILMGVMILSLISCSKKTEDSTQESNVILEEPKVELVDSAKSTNNGVNNDAEEGLALIQGSDCLTCHQTKEKLVGPSYQDVANKYSEDDIDMLADRIINGSNGVWGEVPMAAHSGLSKENAKKMVRYILSLK